MWLHFSNAVPVVFGSSDPKSDLFKRGAEWAGVCYAVKDGVTFVAAFALMALSQKMARRRIHGVCLALGGLGLLAIGCIHGEEHKNFLLLALALGGIAWASILSMPYAILAGALPPARMGVYMGIFNMMIVIPLLLVAATLPLVYDTWLQGDPRNVMVLAGVLMLFGALATLRVQVPKADATTAL